MNLVLYILSYSLGLLIKAFDKQCGSTPTLEMKKILSRIINSIISNEVMAIRIKKKRSCQVNVSGVPRKMFGLHIEAFHPYEGILTKRPCWSLSDPEFRQRPARTYTEDALIRVKSFSLCNSNIVTRKAGGINLER